MNPDLEHLVVLQAMDFELTRLRRELVEAPQRVKKSEADLAAAERVLTGCREGIAQEERLRRDQESEIAGQRTKVERLRRSLDAATSTAQVSAFEHEISFTRAAIAKLEDEELASLERTDTLDAELRYTQAKVESQRDELAGERTRAARTKSENEAAIASIAHERTSLRAQIDERWLATYDRLSKAKGTAVAEALGSATAGKCAACQMTVRPQRWQDLTGRDHLDEIFVCESCGRLLFWDPRRDTPRAWDAGDRLLRARGEIDR